jgi:hypothetical protein
MERHVAGLGGALHQMGHSWDPLVPFLGLLVLCSLPPLMGFATSQGSWSLVTCSYGYLEAALPLRREDSTDSPVASHLVFMQM